MGLKENQNNNETTVRRKKWYHTNVGIVVVLFLFFPAGLYLMWRYATWKTGVKWKVTGIVTVLFLIYNIFAYTAGSYREGYQQGLRDASRNQAPAEIASTSVTEKKQSNYEIVHKQDNNAVENYQVLIKPGDNGKDVAMEVKKQCSKQCNINIYDDRKALDLQKQYDDMMGTLSTNPQDLEAWKQQNYIFVADHFVGYIPFDIDEYLEYPYKDKFYDQLNGTN